MFIIPIEIQVLHIKSRNSRYYRKNILFFYNIIKSSPYSSLISASTEIEREKENSLERLLCHVHISCSRTYISITSVHRTMHLQAFLFIPKRLHYDVYFHIVLFQQIKFSIFIERSRRFFSDSFFLPFYFLFLIHCT